MFDFFSLSLNPEGRKTLADQFNRNLGEPLKDLYSRPKKEVRSLLVELGYELIAGGPGSAPEVKNALHACSSAIEALHTGSLIIDDIQDLSQWRRGGPTLHLKYGVPVALNAGNWLYFYAFQKIREGVPEASLRLQLFELMEQVLREAHLGQALDLGTDITQSPPLEVIELSKASLEMKSGALMALSLLMGGVVAGASESQLEQLKNFGICFGVNLQMFDDLGNVKVDRPTKKHLEDLVNRRPSFFWWVIAQEFPQEFPKFVAAINHLPDTKDLAQLLLDFPVLQRGRELALENQNQVLTRTENFFSNRKITIQKFQQIAEKVAHAY